MSSESLSSECLFWLRFGFRIVYSRRAPKSFVLEIRKFVRSVRLFFRVLCALPIHFGTSRSPRCSIGSVNKCEPACDLGDLYYLGDFCWSRLSWRSFGDFWDLVNFCDFSDLGDRHTATHFLSSLKAFLSRIHRTYTYTGSFVTLLVSH